jgi:outer membrane protein assembly factor BamD
MSHFQQLKTIDRDQSHTLKSKEEFERLVKRFPRDDYAKRARKNIRKCLVYLAEYELYVGHFYYKMEKYRAAMARYTYLMNTYPDMGQYHEALEYMRRCKEELSKETKK